MASSSMYLPKNTPSWIALLVPPFLFFAIFSGRSVLSISITSLALVISTVILTQKKPEPISKKQNQEEEEEPVSSSEIKNIAPEQHPESEDVDEMAQIQNLYSDESESLDDQSSSSEDYSDIDSKHCSDGSISDEESLFEISLPSGHIVGNEKESSKVCLQQMNKVAADYIFRQHCLMEFLTDMNQEDNMIEIDISRGSIKCSGFEIEA